MSKIKNTELRKANELMQLIAQITINKKQLQDSIANELKAYNEGLKKYETELLQIAERNSEDFNEDGNLVLDHGYVHTVNNTVVITGKKFDATKFQSAFPDMIDLTKALKLSQIKKAFLEKETRKELKSLGVDITTEQALQIVPDTKSL